jgi:aldose 1-epimerase
MHAVNVAQHSYFNLAGHASGSVLDHFLTLHGADHFTPVDATQIPTGEVLPVEGTPFDFSRPHKIGERIDQVEGGYDHNYVLFGMGPQAKFLVKNGMASDR